MAVEYFDGRSSRPRAARLSARGRTLQIESTAGEVLRELPFAELQWPERQRHGARVAHLGPGGVDGALHCKDSAAWDAFARAVGAHESWVVRAQQNWRATLAMVAALLLLALAGYLWGLPLAARGMLNFVPPSLDRAVGQLALQNIDGRWLQPSQAKAADHQRLRDAFARLVERSHPGAERPAYELRFHKSKIGPNAFALPGGTIVVTDELLELLAGHDDAVLGVLAHELGHVQHRHGMRVLVQFTLLSSATSIAFGDFSGLLVGVPAWLGQMAYSRDFEREADARSVQLLRAAGLSPAAMVVFFDRIGQWKRSDEGRRTGAGLDLGIAFSSHPADEERIAFFRDAARH